jgi:flagellar capping protein FliD
MGQLRLPGLLTGIDTATLISQLMTLEKRTMAQYQVRQAAWSERKIALSTLEAKLTTLKNTAAALSDAEKLRAASVTSSDTDILTAEASIEAFEGSHTVVVNQLASAERWVHTAGKEYAEDYVGAGTFLYSYNRQQSVITTTAETTLEDLVGLINNDANNPGVTASLLYHNETYHLVLNGNNAGSDYSISVDASNVEVWQGASAFTAGDTNATLTDKLVDLDQFDGALAGDESLTIGGKRHDGTVVNQNFVINGNTELRHLLEEIDDAFGGTATATLVNGQIRLTDHTGGASLMELSLTYHPGSGATAFDLPAINVFTEGGTVTASLAGFTGADFTETQSARDSQIKVDGYPPGDEEWIARSSNTIDDVIAGVTLHLHDTGTVQVSLARDLQSVKGKLNSMVSAYNAVVSLVEEQTGYDAVQKKGGVLMGDGVIPSIAEDLRLPLIQQTRGFFANVDSFLMPGHVGLELDGEGQLSLTAGTFDKAIADDYLGALALVGADKTGTSDSNTIGFHDASSDDTVAGTYDVEVTIVGGAITAARIKRADEADYRDAGFSENIVTGDSTTDANGNPLYAESGLQLSVNLDQDGTFTAQVRVKQGFAGAIADALEQALQGTTGALALDRKQVDDQIEHLKDQIEIEEKRLTQKEARLVAKYARLEKTLTLLQNQLAALSFATTG